MLISTFLRVSKTEVKDQSAGVKVTYIPLYM